MEVIKFTIPGEPVAKGRPRFAVRGKFARVYTPAKTIHAENLVSVYGKVAMQGRKPLAGAIELKIEAFMPIPVSTSKANRAKMLSNEIKHTKRPDWDNLGKLVSDALNGICWLDDSQIVDCRCIKRYSDNPRIEVTIKV